MKTSYQNVVSSNGEEGSEPSGESSDPIFQDLAALTSSSILVADAAAQGQTQQAPGALSGFLGSLTLINMTMNGFLIFRTMKI